ncbi:hypothetical protein DWB68_10245 [Galactobacter valiniphilus]|uniref:Uncharacterized protein n=1 Tax=Galactobacter valiniphilus TaxID=2676122 RepID=A0A399JBI4_9MICC|nr:hypothetical protein [Galactobacter valiniphilus]RII41897.1 hypothetical protein DWB68_10245 [Galactobacter valiniphilus]
MSIATIGTWIIVAGSVTLWITWLPRVPERATWHLTLWSRILMCAGALLQIIGGGLVITLVSVGLIAACVWGATVDYYRERLTQVRISLTLARVEADDALTALARRDGSARSFSEAMQVIGERSRARL